MNQRKEGMPMTCMMRGLFVLALNVATLLAMSAPGAAQDAPSGKVEITAITIAAGFGATWGDGTLTLQDGSTHKFSVEYIKMVAAGVSTVQAEGNVFNLKRVRDLEGNYVVGEAGLAVGAGLSGLTMKNENGVVINLKATQVGINFTLSLGGMTIKVKSHLF